MKVSDLRKEVKKMIIAQGGKFYNYNGNCLKNRYNVSVVDIQNACNYFRYSPQQEKFREKYNFH